MKPAAAIEPAFVLSLLLSDAADPSGVVLGVRRSRPQSPRHPGVLSTVTQRVPEVLFRALQPQWPSPTGRTIVLAIPPRPSLPIGEALTARHPLSYAVESLLARKLALADALAAGALGGRASAIGIASAVVDDPGGTGAAEPTVMLTVRVVLDGLHAALPSRTAHFDPVVTSEMAAFVAAARSNDALLVDDRLDPFEVCIGGLCVASAADLISSDLDAIAI